MVNLVSLLPFAPKLHATEQREDRLGNMSGVHCVAIIYPAPGKVDRLRELLGRMCRDVHSKEDYTVRYIMTEQIDADNPEIVMIETYKDKASNEKHMGEPHFKELFATFDKEELLAKPPYVVKTASKAGFDLDRKLI